MASLYANGIGTAPDLVEAFALATIVDVRGCDGDCEAWRVAVSTLLDQTHRRMTRQQIEEGRARAYQIAPELKWQVQVELAVPLFLIAILIGALLRGPRPPSESRRWIKRGRAT